VTDTRTVTFLKGLLLAGAVILYLWPLATPPGIAAAAVATLAATLLARRLDGVALKGPRWALVGFALMGIGVTAGQSMKAWVPQFIPPALTLQLADAVSAGLVAFALFGLLRLLSTRYRAASLLELSVVVVAVANTFAAHRHQRIHQPRALADWAWSRGWEPETVLTAFGIAAVAIAAVLLVRANRATRLLSMLAVLLIGGLLFFLFGQSALPALADGAGGSEQFDEPDGGGSDADGGGSGGGQSNQPPKPVAVAVLHDELPEAEVLYFRQAVRSKLSGVRLVEDGTGTFDTDVPKAPPKGAPLDVAVPQEKPFHRDVRTSMYLMVDHPQYFGVSFPTTLTPIANPNPRRFVAAYDVVSAFPLRTPDRLLGRETGSAEWSATQRAHYTDMPADPRYVELADDIVADVDPRFVGDDIVKALAIKTYLERKGFYSLKEKNLNGDDPVATFLFGEMKGYCVHFAHAATYLLRSQGIPARVAIGYAVQTEKRGAGSAVLVFANEAHAWPEMYVDGVGWVTFDIYPERSDEPPPQHVDQDMESAMGELARQEPPPLDPDDKPFVMPWAAVGQGLGLLAMGLVVAAWVIKASRRGLSGEPMKVYRGVLDRLSDVGLARVYGESRERHAQRVTPLVPSFFSLTTSHLRYALREPDGTEAQRIKSLAAATVGELKRNLPWPKRLLLTLNPFGWTLTR
jgi:protein-glutamine gamma-glutamyltransferase